MGLEGPSPSHCHASFWSQANALLRKNLTFQKRNIKTNIWLISFPVFLCSLILVLQRVADKEWNEPSDTECGCSKEAAWCYYEYSINGGIRCAFPNPPEWPPLLQIPLPEYRAVSSEAVPFTDLPDESCRTKGSCPAAFLITGNNHSLGSILAGNMLPSSFTLNSSDALFTLADNVIGSEFTPGYSNFQDPAFTSDAFIYTLQRHCPPDFNPSVLFRHSSDELRQEVFCVEGLPLWRNSSSDVNDELYRGYAQGNSEGETNEIFAAYGFSNSNKKNFNVSIWYNSTYKTDKGNGLSTLVRVSRLVNLASNAYLQYLRGHGTKMLFEFVKEMPKPETLYNLDMSSLLGTFFFTLVILHLFPVVLSSLVYEKQQKLRIMMKMHGLGDWPYWMISYVYFLSISLIYMLCFMIFGSVIGLNFFKLNDYSIQFVFYLVYINLQTSVAFLVALMFSNVKTATVTAYIGVFGTGIIGNYLFLSFVEDASFPRQGITLMELYPGFSLNRGLYEFAQSSFIGNYLGTNGMRWEDFGDSSNGMREVLVIMLVEWLMVLFVAYYIDSVLSSGSGTRSLIFLENFRKKFLLSFQKPNSRRQSPKHRVQMEKDVSQEREKVDQLLLEPDTSYAIICDNLKKVYPGKDGNPDKFVVRGLSLALRRGECFGMLGPNGAGKSSFINMVKTVTFLNLNEIEGNSGNALKRFLMISLIKPTSGTAFVEGLDIRTHMSSVYTSMGVCPQHHLLWETLTGREHLLFYGRLKNLTGSALTQAVEDSLKSFNLFHGGVPDKQTRKYSGGMKRRLSIAISLIGDPKVVYMDEPGTGLDPASRKNLWNVMKRAKQDRAIILTTHSMEEAEVLCDRVGIFIDGTLPCIGNPKELIARYGGSYVFTITTSSVHERDVENLVKSSLFPNAKRTYHISGTQKFELPKNEVRIADIFKAVKIVKNRFTVYAWNLADATLEEVFIKVARGAQEQEVNAINA